MADELLDGLETKTEKKSEEAKARMDLRSVDHPVVVWGKRPQSVDGSWLHSWHLTIAEVAFSGCRDAFHCPIMTRRIVGNLSLLCCRIWADVSHTGPHHQPARGAAGHGSDLCPGRRHSVSRAPPFHPHSKLPTSPRRPYYRCHLDHLLLTQPSVIVSPRPLDLASCRKGSLSSQRLVFFRLSTCTTKART